MTGLRKREPGSAEDEHSREHTGEDRRSRRRRGGVPRGAFATGAAHMTRKVTAQRPPTESTCSKGRLPYCVYATDPNVPSGLSDAFAYSNVVQAAGNTSVAATPATLRVTNRSTRYGTMPAAEPSTGAIRAAASLGRDAMPGEDRDAAHERRRQQRGQEEGLRADEAHEEDRREPGGERDDPAAVRDGQERTADGEPDERVRSVPHRA